MSSESFTITLSGLSESEQEKAAADLARAIKRSDQSADVKIREENRPAMDFGASLGVVLGSGAAVAVARGIRAWMGRWQNASIIMSDDHRKVEIQRASSDDIIRAVELFTSPSK
jgi:hypothetical protein